MWRVRGFTQSPIVWRRESRRAAFYRSLSITAARRTDSAQHAQIPGVATERADSERNSKRPWKTVGLKAYPEYFTITLDNKPLRTPAGNLLTVPSTKGLFAASVVNEWERQNRVVKQHALTLTSLVSVAIDTLSDPGARGDAHMDLLKYLRTDTILFMAKEPPQLVELQKRHWVPILEWARAEFNIAIPTSDTLFIQPSPAQAVQTLHTILKEMDQWTLAAMCRAVHSSKSFMIGLALVKGRITAEEAALAARVEVQSQINRWGEVEDTHDVDYRDIRRQLSSAALLAANV
ncbi:ATP12-domain-containing protein [Cantharellus anzutake]|uniref:ATP12-domain-containing protein n=1 Tax=Cantharellus anzutake TaxID=1750568 RepID=UPI0019042B59|nr:ATP12-domain-containing protein [Cantharellus anzutake]KAF8343949.1 ATP12-domain-containing protein [Cantharellus anzutake]